ncbi:MULTISPECIES: hypothetical protein [Saccharothrix]|uniref:hypothetical protein n=1 Tax=Saccharothrix TaxID=2071 RepID=UPI00093EEA68|nr:hypothetical protein [Saccharothrix sp. CB00851]OKI39115.1 hypothetical protein A6A25_02780 [Saccharothrix sp. CB00851]
MTEPVPGQTPEPAAADDATAPPPPAREPETAEPGTTVNPQELFGSLSLSAIEADIDRLMSDKMSQLDGMLAGLEELVQKLEGEITNLEPPPDEADTPKG